MTLERITIHNINLALHIQAELFPEYSARINYEESLDGTTDYEYYLIYDEQECVGITGLYHYPGDSDNAWLGWFGIRESFRRQHRGSAALRLFEEMAVDRGYRFARLYTDVENNDGAIAFYKLNGYTSEPYCNVEDPACWKYKVLIFSKALKGQKLIPWNNENIHLTEQIAKQEKGICIRKRKDRIWSQSQNPTS